MGLSIAIMGGVVSLALISILGALQGSFTDGTFERASTTLEANKVSDAISRLDMEIGSLEAEAANDLLNFTLRNEGAGKFWDYESFDVIIEYDANVGGVKTKTIEQLMFERDSSFLGFFISDIEFDNTTPFNGNCGFPAVSECSFSHEVGAVPGISRILIVGVSPIGGETVTSVEYNNVALTEIRSDDDGGTTHSSLWYLLDPPRGIYNVDVQLSANDDVAIGATSLNYVNQADPIGTDNGNTGNDDTPTVSVITTIDDSWIIDVVGTLWGPMTEGTGQIERWDVVEGFTAGAGSTEATTTSGSYTMSWTNEDGANEWSISAAEIIPLTDPTCTVNSFFDTKDWIVGGISNDVIDPEVINQGEAAQICTKLSHPIFAGGDIKITVSTDLGYSTSDSITLP